MNLYESLISEAEKQGIVAKEKDLIAHDGLAFGNRIAIRSSMNTTKKTCVLSEELGHCHMNFGNILDTKIPNNTKQEHLGRLWGYNRLIGLMGIVRAYEAGCQNQYEIADYLNVSEEFLIEAISTYRSKYGVCTTIDNYTIYFIPSLGVMKIL